MYKKRNLFVLLLLINLTGLYSQNIDIDLLRDINLNRNSQLDKPFNFITNTATPISIAMPLVLYGTGCITDDSLLKQKSIYIGATVLTAAIITTTLKFSINRTRPFVTYPDIQKLTAAGSYSFPSGHTSDAFALATSLSIAFPKWYVYVPSYSWAISIAYSRMHLGAHYPSDVFAGAVVGAGTAYLCFKGQQWLMKKRN